MYYFLYFRFFLLANIFARSSIFLLAPPMFCSLLHFGDASKNVGGKGKNVGDARKMLANKK